MISDRVRVDTPYPCPPELLVRAARRLADQLPEHDRVTVGFPGLVRGGRVVLHPPLSCATATAATSTDGLVTEVDRVRLADALGERVRGARPRWPTTPTCRAAPSSEGKGFEFVLTLGTGVGAALFNDGRAAAAPRARARAVPQGRAPSRTSSATSPARQVGNRTWRERVLEAIAGVRPVPVLRPDLHRRRERQAPERRRPPGERAHRPEHRGHQRRRPDLGPRHVTTA